MTGLSTTVLDTSRGKPAAGLSVILERFDEGAWLQVSRSPTAEDGRTGPLSEPGPWETGTWRLTFDTGAFYAERGKTCFWPEVRLLFEVSDAQRHHHIPLHLARHGYSTCLGG